MQLEIIKYQGMLLTITPSHEYKHFKIAVLQTQNPGSVRHLPEYAHVIN